MDAVNWVLINGANAVHWLGGVLKALFGAVFSAIDAVLNPVLSPVLAFLSPVCTAIGDGVYAVLAPLPVWLGITLLSAVIGVIMLIAFRYTSNQVAIGRARDDITANLLALKLYKNELRVAFMSQRRLLAALLRLQWHMLKPILIMLFPLVLAIAQMGIRYQWRPLHPGEQILVKLHLRPQRADVQNAQLQPSPGIAEVVGPVPGDGVLVWRVRAAEPGRYELRFDVGGNNVEKELVVSNGFERVSAKRPDRRWTSQILHPVEPPLPTQSPVQSIEIAYGGVRSWIYGEDYWVLYFFIVSMVSALVFKPVFRVRF